MIKLEEIKKLHEIIDKETILALEIEDDYGRHWVTGKREVIDERIKNLAENEYFSDLDTCSKQEHPICKEFYAKMNDVDNHNKHCIFNEREYLPFYLIENGDITIEEVRENDLPLLKEILSKKPYEFTYKEDLHGYHFQARIENFTFFVDVPLLIALSKEIDEKLCCRVNYFIDADNRGSIPFAISFSELETFMKKVFDEEYRMSLIA